MDEKLKSMLGLTKRAGKLAIGTENVMSSIKCGKAKAVFLACDISENTAKKIKDSCNYYKKEWLSLPLDMDKLSTALGKECNVSSVAIEDSGLCGAVKKLLREE